MGQQIVELRIVVASPGDVGAERNILETVIAEINRNVGRSFGLRFELVRWETDSYPGFNRDGGQSLIDAVLKIEEADVFIGILWKRFGTPIKGSNSGTEHEFKQAYQAWEKHGSPRIMFYFNQKPYPPLNSDYDLQQATLVAQFKKSIADKGALYQSFTGRKNFEALARDHLTKFLIAYYNEENVLTEDSDAEDEGADENYEDDEDNDEIEPQILRDECAVLAGRQHLPFSFNLNSGDILQFEIASNQPINVFLIDGEDYDDWEQNQTFDAYEDYENRKRVKFSFLAPESGEYTLVIHNAAYFTAAEVDISVYLLAE